MNDQTPSSSPLPEVWLRGPLAGVPALLQPIAHALLQAVEEVEQLKPRLTDESLWKRPAGIASAGFHLQHMTGVLDRLSTYARGEALSDAQMAYLRAESEAQNTSGDVLVAHFRNRVAALIEELKTIDPATLTEFRAVGRKGLPSTVQGLLFHAAEHTMRHLGQLLVTAKITGEIADV